MIEKNQSPNYEDEIDLKELIKILLKSKNIIISSVLFFTLSAYIYTFIQKTEFKSSAILEIGYFEMPNGRIELIENPISVVQKLKVEEFKIQNNNLSKTKYPQLSVEIIADRLIRMNLTSVLPKRDRELLNQYISLVKDHHLKIMDLESELLIKELTSQVDENDSIISTNQSKLDSDENLDFIKALQKLNSVEALVQIFNIEREKNMLVDNLNNLLLEQKKLKNELIVAENRVKVKTQLIDELKTSPITLNKNRIIALGFILGVVTGIFLVFINNFIKSFRELKK